jgi:hypothetical protein
MTIRTAYDAISSSISSSEIVHMDYASDVGMDLSDACDDSSTNDDVTEYWGVTSDGEEWRVHLYCGPNGDRRNE